jgi:hypothetical protein
MERSRDRRKWEVVGVIVEYWQWIVCAECEELVKQGCVWQKDDMSVRRWDKDL